MGAIILTLFLLGVGYLTLATSTPVGKSAIGTKDANLDEALKTDASTYYDRYSDYGSRAGYPSSGYGAGVTGYGILDDRYSNRGYDGYGAGGYAGASGYGNSGYSGYDGYGSAGYGNNGYGIISYGNDRYGSGSYGANGNGGYGGYAGNGGLNSYYGYNNPNNQGYGHLGYGYYNKRPGYGNIYSSGITPSLVTGYRGYSRK